MIDDRTPGYTNPNLTPREEALRRQVEKLERENVELRMQLADALSVLAGRGLMLRGDAGCGP